MPTDGGLLETRAAGYDAARCLACQSRCSKSELRFRCPGRYVRNIKRIEEALRRGGFEVCARVHLQDLARERLAIETAPLTLLYMNHPVLLLQSYFMDGEPSLFLPFLTILRPNGNATDVCISFPWSHANSPMPGLTGHLVQQTREKLFTAVAPLYDPT